MKNFTLFYPVLGQMLLTLFVYVAMISQRIKAAKNREVSIKYYQNYSEGKTTQKIITWGRHLSNQFELPVLFYAVCIMHTMVGGVSSFAVTVAWLFFAARVIHAFVHLTYNNVMHRMFSFAASVVFVVVLIINLMLKLNKTGISNFL